MAPLGLSSARWQVLGAIAEGEGALSTAQIARKMGLARQSVQRLVDELAHEGVLAFAPNPQHRRAKLVQLTRKGEQLFERASLRWAKVADSLAEGLGPRTLENTIRTLRLLRSRLEPPGTEE